MAYLGSCYWEVWILGGRVVYLPAIVAGMEPHVRTSVRGPAIPWEAVPKLERVARQAAVRAL